MYPKMLHFENGHIRDGHSVSVYDKIDGTNLAWYWNDKKGWWKSSTRTTQFDESDPMWGYTHKIFQEKNIILPYRSAIVYTELYGPGSFAGTHLRETIKNLYVIDIFADGEWLLPHELENFGCVKLDDIKVTDE